jgi:hypothetical protein
LFWIIPPAGAVQVFEPQVTDCPPIGAAEASLNVTTGRVDPVFDIDASMGPASEVSGLFEVGDPFELLQAASASHAGTRTLLRISLRVSMFGHTHLLLCVCAVDREQRNQQIRRAGRKWS